MNNIYLFLSILVVVSFLFQVMLRKLAIKKSLYDIPNYRSSHNLPTPRVGGIGIVVTWYILIIIGWPVYFDKSYLFIFLSALPITIISIMDDFINIRVSIRILIQFISLITGLAIIFLKQEEFSWSISWLLLFLVMLFSGIWFINLFNFLDGIDGYAAAQGILFFLISFYFTKEYYLLLIAAIVIGFLVMNWYPARIFMGDTGSTLLGYIIFISAIIFYFKRNQELLLSMAFTSVFWLDATVTLFRRFQNKEQLIKAHKKHAYQRLTQSGMKHSQVTLILCGIYCLLFCLYILLFENLHQGTLITFILSLGLSFGFLIFAELRKPFPKNLENLQ